MTEAQGRAPVTTAEAAELLGIPETLIWSWKDRRRIKPVGKIRGRGPNRQASLWDLAELEAVASTYRPRPRHADENGS